MYAAATKKSMFDGGDIQLNRLIEYPTGFGFVLSGNMAKAAPLFRIAIAAKKPQISQIVKENTDSISLDRNEAEEAREKSSGLFDPTAETFLDSLTVNMSLLVVVIIAGLAFRMEQKKEHDMEETIPSLRIFNYLKSDGRQTLEEFMASLQRQIQTLRNKQIKERKNTWFYKQNKKTQTQSNLAIFRSTARVSPEVSTAGSEDGTRVTTSLRQPLVLSFYEGKKFAQVYPMKERCSSQGYHSQTSLKKLDGQT